MSDLRYLLNETFECDFKETRAVCKEKISVELFELLESLVEEIHDLRNELELVRTRCDRNRDTSSDWMD